jgi:hypothetical protein
MRFEEKFLDLANPFFDLCELANNAQDDVVDRYSAVVDRIEPLKAKLSDLAKGDSDALVSLNTFFTDDKATEFMNSANLGAFLKILALASNITTDTWNEEAAEVAPLQAFFLNAGEQIEQPYSASRTPLTNFFYNSTEVVDSVALIDFRSDPNSTELSEPETWTASGKDIVEAWAVLFLLEDIAKVNNCVAVISSAQNTEKAISYLKYHLVMSGNTLTLPVPLDASNEMSDIQQILVAAKDYTQFVEPLAMLGEVNSCDNILDTFLTTYHVLENYMIRSEVSSVLSNSAGPRFQRVRDFKRLGQQTAASEITHLTNLFKKCWQVQIGDSNLQTTLEQSFSAIKLETEWDDGEFDEFLVQLGVLKRNGNQITLLQGFNDEQGLQNNFIKLVYSIRCSIVHNKATEFHLSNEELRRKSIRVLVIVKWCLPVMFRLAFGLPSSSPDMNPIHYQTRQLLFY